MNDIECRQRMTDFIRLQVPDEMPLDSRRGRGLLPHRFLDLILAGHDKPGVERFANDFIAMSLRHGDNFHFADVAPRFRASEFDARANFRKYPQPKNALYRARTAISRS